MSMSSGRSYWRSCSPRTGAVASGEMPSGEDWEVMAEEDFDKAVKREAGR